MKPSRPKDKYDYWTNLAGGVFLLGMAWLVKPDGDPPSIWPRLGLTAIAIYGIVKGALGLYKLKQIRTEANH